MYYVIGDIHSNIKELRKLIKLIKPKKKDVLIFNGDLINKNKDMIKTLKFLKTQKKYCDCIFVKGNHDYSWQKYLLEKDLNKKEFLLKYGGKYSFSEFKDGKKLFEYNNFSKLKRLFSSFLYFVERMVDYYLIKDYIIIHGGLLESQLNQKELKIVESNYFLRPNKINKYKKYLGKYRIIGAHTSISKEPYFSEAYINIDTGAGYGKFLSAYIIEKGEVIRSDGKIFNDEFVKKDNKENKLVVKSKK